MKNLSKVFGFIALAAVIGLSMVGCDDLTGGAPLRLSPPAAPRALTATAYSSSEIYLSWNSVSGASGYKVYASSSSNGTYLLAETVTANYTYAYNGSPNTTYYFRVKAYNSDGESGYSNTASATTLSSTVSVTSVSLNKDTLTLTVGETATLTATVSPSNATNKSVTWSSSNPSVASITPNGSSCTVTGVSAGGPLIITVTTADGNRQASCVVTVSSSINLTLDGVWQRSAGYVITINGSTGVYTDISGVGVSGAMQSAREKGYIKVGDVCLRNLTKTGDLTWTGQQQTISNTASSPNVATGTNWRNCTITLDANGLTFRERLYTTTTGDVELVWTRR